jgi:CheY-like chemotaxis protein/curved DNA-binding protein CbpA
MKQQAPKARVLVVEDNQDVRNVVTVYLRSHGYLVEEAVDGMAAVEHLEQSVPEVILLDVLLPRLDGIETLRRLRQIPSCAEVPVVMMSAVLQIRDLQAETARLKVSSFLQKPFQMRKLVELIEQALDPGKAVGVKPRRPSPTRRVGTEPAEPAKGPPAASTTAVAARTTARTVTKPKKKQARPDDGRVVFVRRDLSPSGALELTPLPEVMHSVFSEHRTGRLRVTSGSIEKRIYFQNGLPVYAESSLPEETLGAHLMARGRITPEEHALTREEMTRSGRLFGETLLKLGLLDPHELFTEIEAHLAEKVISTFGWFEGMYHFEDDDSWKDDVIIARMKPGRILLDGIVRHWSAGTIRQRVALDSRSTTFTIDGSPYSEDQLGLSTREAKIMQLARRGLSVADITRQLADADLVLSTLYALFIMEHVGFKPPRAQEQRRLDDMLGKDAKTTISTPPRKDEREGSMLAEYLKLRTADYFTLLGVPRDAPDEQITRAFEERQKRYHPDTLIGLDTGLVHEKMEELYIRVHTAYRTLIDPEDKRHYLEKLERGAKGTGLTSRAPAARAASAGRKERHKALFDQGFAALRSGDYKTAMASFEQANALAPRPRYRGYRAWAAYLLDPDGARGSSEREIAILMKENEADPLFPYLLGNLALRQRNAKRAIAMFETALEIDPQHIDSARQLRILRMRQRSNETSGLFDIFKKK